MTAQQWAPFATRRDGPSAKHGYPGFSEPSRKTGIVCHSMEGSLAAALGELDKPTRLASWTFSNPKVGPMLQHYAVGQHTWASGSLQANVLYTSCEHEGKAGEPLTENQIANLVTLIEWLHEQHDWTAYDRRIQLWEHKEAAVFYGGGATACPSDRIPWPEVMKRLKEGEAVTEAQMALLLAAIKESTQASKDLLTFLKLALKNLDDDHARIEAKLT